MTAPEAEKPRIDVDPEKASTNFYWLLGTTEVFNLQTTIRGNLSDEEISSHMRSAVAGMKQALALGGHAKAVGKNGDAQTFVPPTTPAQAAIETGKANVPPSGPRPAAVETSPYETPHVGFQQPAQKQVNELVAVKVEITPVSEGKAELKFYEAGHKWPDLYSKRAAKDWSGVLGWAQDEFMKAQTFDGLNLRIGYTLSDKLNSKGNPYKDIAYIKAA